MNNLFARERSYRTNFFLEFKNAKTEARFRQDNHSHAVYSLVGFLIISIIIIMGQFMDSTCFRYSTDCKLEYLTILSLISTMGSLVLISQNQSLHFIRALLLIISLYMHLSILDRFEYTAALLLIVLQTTISTSLVFDCWKYHVIYNTISYIMLFWGINFYDMRQFYRKDLTEVRQDFAIFHLLATAGVAFLERSYREKWMLMDSLRRSSKVFQRLFEDSPQPIILIDGNKNIILINRRGLELLAKVDRRLVLADLARGGPSPSSNLLRRINFLSLIDSDYQEVVAATLEGLTAETKSRVRVAFKKPREMSNTSKFDKTEASLTNVSMTYASMTHASLTNGGKIKNWEDYGPIYDMELSDFIWKGKKSFLLTLQDINTPIKNQNLLISNLNKAVNGLEEQIFNLEKDYDKMMTQVKKGDITANLLQPVSKTILSLTDLKNCILNIHSLNSYLSNFGRQQFAQAEFNLKQFIVYLVEIFSVQSIQNKIEINLNFGNGFPEYVSSDASVFQQLFCNLFKNIIKNLRDETIDITCGVRNVIAGGAMLMEFKIESAQTETLNAKTLKDSLNFLMHDNYEQLYLKMLTANDIDLELGILPILLRDTEGGVEILEGERVTTILVFPMSHFLPDSNSLEKMSDTVSKVNLTHTRTTANPSKYIWKKEVVLPEIKITKADTTSSAGMEDQLATSILSQSSTRNLPSVRSERPSKDETRSDKHLTYAEFKENQKHGDIAKSPVVTKRTTEISKIKGTREGLMELIKGGRDEAPGSGSSGGSKLNLPNIREESEDILGGGQSPMYVKTAVTEWDFSKTPHPSIFRREPMELSRMNSSTFGFDHKPHKIDLTSPGGFGLTNNFNLPTLDEQLVKTIIIFTLIELLSKQPPPNAKNQQDSSKPNELALNLSPSKSQNSDQKNAAGIYGSDAGKISGEDFYLLVIHRLNIALKNESYAKIFQEYVTNMGNTFRKRLITSLATVKMSLKLTTIEEILSAPHNFSSIGHLDSTRNSPKATRRNVARRMDSARLKEIGALDNSEALDDENKQKPSDLLDPLVRITFPSRSKQSVVQLRPISKQNKHVASTSKVPLEEEETKANAPSDKKESSGKKKSSWQKTLLPFDVEESQLPIGLKDRTKTKEKKWVGIVLAESDACANSQKHYRYNEVFTLLAVEDNPFQLKQLTDELPRTCQYQIKMEGAKNGIEAYKRFEVLLEESVLFHMILMDLEMPFWDGFEATTAIRQLESELQAPRTYICGLSANTDESNDE